MTLLGKIVKLFYLLLDHPVASCHALDLLETFVGEEAPTFMQEIEKTAHTEHITFLIVRL